MAINALGSMVQTKRYLVLAILVDQLVGILKRCTRLKRDLKSQLIEIYDPLDVAPSLESREDSIHYFGAPNQSSGLLDFNPKHRLWPVL